VFVASFAVIVPFVIIAEKKRKMKPVFLGAIVVLILSNIGLFQFNSTLIGVIGFLWLFFCGFNLLEASLPSLISKTAPGDMRGTAMGIYTTYQFLGAGIGGSLGGWCYGEYGASAVFLLCALLALSWLLLSFGMKPPRYWANLLVSLQALSQPQADEFATEMLKLSGVEDVTLHHEESVAYLKIDNQILDRQALQAVITKYTQG
jgi:MFS family permease